MKMTPIQDHWFIPGTSNWSADYFLSTGGIGVIFGPAQNETISEDGTGDKLRQQLADIFVRDWQSEYSHQP
jgi:phospholipase D3/4